MDNAMHQVVVRIYRGKVNYDANGNVTSENQEIKVPFPSKEWGQFLELAPTMYTKVDLVKVMKETITHYTKTVGNKEVPQQKHDYNDVEASEEIKIAIDSLFSKKVVLTPEQIQIAELTARLAKLECGKVEEVPVNDAKKEADVNASNSELPKEGYPKADLTPEQIEAIKDEYTALFGEKPHHKTAIETIVAKIEAKKSENV